MSKISVPDSITNFIRKRTLQFGRVKLVLKHNKYYAEPTHHKALLQTLLKDDVIWLACVHTQVTDSTTKAVAFTTGKVPVKGTLTIPWKERDDKETIDMADCVSSMPVVGADTGDIFCPLPVVRMLTGLVTVLRFRRGQGSGRSSSHIPN